MADRMVKVNLGIAEQARFEDVLAQAGRHGFRKEAAMPMLGIASGSAPESALAALRTLDGITSVEEEKTLFTAR
jgi:hypothetical protein